MNLRRMTYVPKLETLKINNIIYISKPELKVDSCDGCAFKTNIDAHCSITDDFVYLPCDKDYREDKTNRIYVESKK